MIHMNNMLEYEIITSESDINSYPIHMNTTFYIKNPSDIQKNYKVGIFVVSFLSDKIYPCKLESKLTNNKIDCFDKDSLQNIILEELETDETKQKLYNILRLFYSEEEIKNN